MKPNEQQERKWDMGLFKKRNMAKENDGTNVTAKSSNNGRVRRWYLSLCNKSEHGEKKWNLSHCKNREEGACEKEMGPLQQKKPD